MISAFVVPSRNRTPAVVLTTIEFGLDRYPIESRIVTARPGVCVLERSTTYVDAFDVSTDVSTSTTDVLPFTVVIPGIPTY